MAIAEIFDTIAELGILNKQQKAEIQIHPVTTESVHYDLEW